MPDWWAYAGSRPGCGRATPTYTRGMPPARPWPVVLLPGSILPVQLAYGALLGVLGEDVDARAKDLEMYASETVPPPGYSLATEVEGILRAADDAGLSVAEWARQILLRAAKRSVK